MSTSAGFDPRTLAGECYCLALKRAARAAARRYDLAFKPLAINSGQFSMLAVLAARGTASVQQVAEVLGMDRTTVTAALKPLQRRSLVKIDVSMEDARGRDVALTAKGRALFDRAVPRWREAQRESARLFSADGTDVRDALRRAS